MALGFLFVSSVLATSHPSRISMQRNEHNNCSPPRLAHPITSIILGPVFADGGGRNLHQKDDLRHSSEGRNDEK